MIIIVLITWYLFSSLTGVIDAILYSKKGADSFTWNEHIIYVAQRITVVLLFIIGYFCVESINNMILVICSFTFSFPFFHNGVYYITRSKIDYSKYKFTSTSTTSSSFIVIPFWLRLAMLIISYWFIVAIYTQT